MKNNTGKQTAPGGINPKLERVVKKLLPREVLAVAKRLEADAEILRLMLAVKRPDDYSDQVTYHPGLN